MLGKCIKTTSVLTKTVAYGQKNSMSFDYICNCSSEQKNTTLRIVRLEIVPKSILAGFN